MLLSSPCLGDGETTPMPSVGGGGDQGVGSTEQEKHFNKRNQNRVYSSSKKAKHDYQEGSERVPFAVDNERWCDGVGNTWNGFGR